MLFEVSNPHRWLLQTPAREGVLSIYGELPVEWLIESGSPTGRRFVGRTLNLMRIERDGEER